MMRRAGVIALAALALGGCGLFESKIKDARFKPAELPKLETNNGLTKIWSTSVSNGKDARAGQKLTIAVAEGKAFLAGADGEVVAVDSATGRRIWEVKTGERISAGPGSDGSRVVIGTLDGDVICLDASDGEELWRSDVASEVLAQPVVTSKVVIISAVSGRILSLDATRGTQNWTFDSTVPLLSLRGASSPVIDGDRVIIGAANGKAVALSLDRGDPLWEALPGDSTGRNELERLVDIDGRFIVDRGDVFVSAHNGKTLALTGNVGNLLWAADVGSANGLGTDSTSVYVSDDKSVIVALNKRSGGEIWRSDSLRERQLTAPVALGDVIVVGDFEGLLHVLSSTDGTVLGRTALGGEGFNAAPIVVDGTLYAITRDGKVGAFTRQ